jgi:rod shape-determining protein MreC
MPRKRYWLLLFLFIASIVLMTYQSQNGAIRPFGFLGEPLFSVNHAISSIKSAIGESFRKYTLREEELDRMRGELDALRLKEQQYMETEIENRRLNALLGLRQRQEGYVAAARVVARGSDRWANTFVIDKGRGDGVQKDMAVVTVAGLLGKIQEARDSYSTVLLIDDPRFSAAARLQSSRQEAVLSGGGPGRCDLKYMPTDTEVKKGETVLTSGLDSLFPPGLRAGFVSEVATDKEALFHDIQVVPYVDTSKVEEVIVVKR